jgi:hypothetical protein
MTTHELLVAARNLIDREGWKQAQARYSFGPGDGRCAYVALCDACGFRTILANQATAVLARFIPRTDETANADLYDWNDHPDRTKAEVLALFDRAIAATAPEPTVDFLVAEPELVA